MKRNAFGQLGATFVPAYHRPFLRYFDGENGAGGSGGSNDGGSGSEFTPIGSQEELNRIIAERVARADRTAREDERRKIADAAKPDAKDETASKPDDKAQGVSETDVDKRITDALKAERLELALERVNDGLDKALDGRAYSASKLFTLDRKQFVKEDGKTVDQDALAQWVKDNSTAVETPRPGRRPIPGQGDRDTNATGGSVQSGRDLYDEKHSKNKSGKD